MKNNDNFFICLSLSSALHLLVIYLFLFGIPFLPHQAFEEQIITFEMLNISDVSNIPTQTKNNPEPTKEEVIDKEDSKNVTTSPTEPLKTEEPKIVEEKQPEPQKIEEVKPKEEPINIEQKEKLEEKKKEEIKPKEEEKPKIIPPKPKPPKKKLPTHDDLDSLLKNIEQASSGTNPKSNKHVKNKTSEGEKESKGPYNEGQPLSISEKGLIKKQIENYWNIPIGAEDIDQARIFLHIILENDGTVKEVKITKKICGEVPFAICQALADSAVRAVKQASPIENLNPARYDSWKEFNLEMDPSQAAGG